MQVDEQFYYFFIVVNPTSGGNQAGALTSPGLDVLTTKKPHACKLWFGNITEGKSGQKPIFLKLQACLDEINYQKSLHNKSPCIGVPRVIVAGGDGTVLWTISELEKQNIPLQSVAIGVIPFGTGNDFAQANNWGYMEKNIFAKEWAGFNRMLQKWIDAEISPYDLWEIKIEVDQELGCFKQIDKGKNKVYLEEIDENGEKTKKVFLSTKMMNYFSFGLESRIGLGFDRNRAKSRIANKLVYLNETFKKVFKKTLKIPDLLERIEMLDPENEEKVVKTLFDNSNGPHMKGNPCSFIAINIPSMFGGCPIWDNASNRYGQEAPRQEIKKQPFLTADCKQEEGDRQIEFVTYQRSLDMGIEQLKMGTGVGRRFYQGPGPFRMVFKKCSKDEPIVTYAQVDGEFTQLVNPKYIYIIFCTQIKVLKCQKTKKDKKCLGKSCDELGEAESTEPSNEASNHSDPVPFNKTPSHDETHLHLEVPVESKLPATQNFVK